MWPDVLERTADMWASGRLLKTTGKLRLRGDGYSLACDQVANFEPPAMADEPGVGRCRSPGHG